MLEILPQAKRGGRDTWSALCLPSQLPPAPRLAELRGQLQSSLGDVVPRYTEQSRRRAGDGSERRQIVARHSPWPGSLVQLSPPHRVKSKLLSLCSGSSLATAPLPLNVGDVGTPAARVCHLCPLLYSVSSAQVSCLLLHEAFSPFPSSLKHTNKRSVFLPLHFLRLCLASFLPVS